MLFFQKFMQECKNIVKTEASYKKKTTKVLILWRIKILILTSIVQSSREMRKINSLN